MKVRSIAEATDLARRVGGTLKNEGGAVLHQPEDPSIARERAVTDAMTKIAEKMGEALSRIDRASEIQARALVMIATQKSSAPSPAPQPAPPAAAPRSPGAGFHVEIVRNEKNDLIEGLIITPLRE
jgi:hypothetical protein